MWYTNDTREDKAMIKEIFPNAKEVSLMKEVLEDSFIQENFPAIEKVYSINGAPGAFITSGTGYVGTIRTLIVMDNDEEKISGIKILEQGDTPDYADPIKETWFINRFKDLGLLEYLRLVVLDPQEPTDIVQVTGASVSSQAVVNNVNSAIGAWNYLKNGVKTKAVDNFISQEMWEKDENSFLIAWPENNAIRVNMEELGEFEKVSVETILQRTTGVKIDIQAAGPLLKDVLEKNGIDLSNYEAIGITGRDNYYTMISKDILQNRDIILGIEFNGEEIVREEKPVRIVVPDEMGVYWVKMVNRIELYESISPKDIQSVYIFDTLVRDIEPYYYEYYGSKDKSYLIGKILNKFPYVDPNGFFTMVGSDGLVKNETMSMVRDRYYLKVEGDNAPMNIGPAFKLGMNVKEMTHFSTTTDAVIFPNIMLKSFKENSTIKSNSLSIELVLDTVGMIRTENDKLIIVDTNGEEYVLANDEIENSYLETLESRTDAIIGNERIEDVKKITKISK